MYKGNSEQELIDELKEFCMDNSLAQLSAYEIPLYKDANEYLTTWQCNYLQCFIERWELMKELQEPRITMQRAKYNLGKGNFGYGDGYFWHNDEGEPRGPYGSKDAAKEAHRNYYTNK